MGEKTPFFSVLIPVYNVEKYLDECINSVLSQDFGDYEIILVNDGSTDKSGGICDKYAKEYTDKIKVIHKENEGLLMARITGMKAAKGKYFMFLDSDDIYLDGILNTVHDDIINNSSDMVIFDYMVLKSDGKLYPPAYVKYDHTRLFSGNDKIILYDLFLATSNLNSVCSKCVRQGLFDSNYNYSKWKGINQAEDALVSLGFFDRAQRISYIQQFLYGYRVNEQSITHTKSLKNFKDVITVNEILSEHISSWNISENAKNKFYKNMLIFSVDYIRLMHNDTKNKKTSKSEYSDLVKYAYDVISSDNNLKIALNELRFIDRVSVKLILKKFFNILYTWLTTIRILSDIKQMIKDYRG